MKLKSSLSTCLFLCGFAVCTHAQNTASFTTLAAPSSDWGPRTGGREIALGGVGGTNNDFNSSFGGLNGSDGPFFSDTLEVSLRQSINCTNPGGADS